MSVFLDIFLPMISAFIICAVLCPLTIPVLRKLKLGQSIREEGPKAHLNKSGTPTMGGAVFLVSTLLTAIPYAITRPRIWPVLFITLGFGLVGFLDDFLKVYRHNSDGLRPWQKLLGQFVVTGVFCFWLMQHETIDMQVLLPFTGGKAWNLGWVFIPFVFLVVLGTVNGTNFTDGLDGLASSVTTVVSLFLAAAAGVLDPQLMPLATAFAGALMGFLMFNVYPAKVFMGDTGSLAIGGFVAGAALMLRIPIFILIFGFIYLIEVISVILQVGYFKATHGRRIFRMAPIHHHFELGGWSEPKVVACFTVVTLFLCIAAFMAL